MQESTEERLIRTLAEAIVQYPRANLQELAAAVDVSKATLYRFARTREQIVKKVHDYSVTLSYRIIDEAGLETNPPLDVLRYLINEYVAHSAFTNFLLNHGHNETRTDEDVWSRHQELLDAFFLRGQKMGAFRMDVPAAYLNEFFSALICGFAASKRSGRVARSGLQDSIEALMLNGAVGARQDRL